MSEEQVNPQVTDSVVPNADVPVPEMPEPSEDVKALAEEVLGEEAPETPPEAPEAAPEASEDPETTSDTPQPVAPDTLAAHNAEGMDAAQRKGEESGEEPEEVEFAAPMFFAEPEDRHRVELDILIDKDGQLQSVSASALNIDFSDLPYLKLIKCWFEFSIPGYEDVATYRQRSAVYNAQAQGMVIDRIQYRNFLLAWHLKDWSLTGRDNKKIELEHRKDGRLNDDSLKQVYALRPPTLVDVVLSSFEKDALMSNAV
jgi:hypothetical protein